MRLPPACAHVDGDPAVIVYRVVDGDRIAVLPRRRGTPRPRLCGVCHVPADEAIEELRPMRVIGLDGKLREAHWSRVLHYVCRTHEVHP